MVREVPEAAFDEDKKYYQGFDWVRFVDDNGNVRMDGGEPMEKCFGIEGTIQIIEKKDEYVIFKVEGDKAGTNLLKFLAQPGANVEWTQLKTGEGESGANYLSTSWDPKMNTSTQIVLSTYLPPTTSVLREYIHSHPLDDPNPSGRHDRINPKTGKHEKAGTWGDVGVKNLYQAKNQYGSGVVFKIYLPALDDYVIF